MRLAPASSDLDVVGRRSENPWYLDYDAPQRMLRVGMTRTEVPEHVLFRRAPGMTFSPGPVELGFFVTVYEDRGAVKNPWARTSDFLWQQWAKPLYEDGEPIRAPLETYVERPYKWAFRGWGDSVWQEFEVVSPWSPGCRPNSIANLALCLDRTTNLALCREGG